MTSYVVILLCLLIVLMRINAVGNERKRILELLYHQGLRDMDAGLIPFWRYRDYDRHSFEEMVYKFWKPVRQFYAGARCTIPHEELDSTSDIPETL